VNKNMESEIMDFILKILAYGGGGAGVAYLIFMFLGKKWIENKFSERLEAYKHAQNRELEKFKYEINRLFSRVTKIHEKEFEVLPQAWIKMQDALGQISQLTSLYQEYPDLNRINKSELDDFLSNSELKDFEKQELKNSTDKTAYFQELSFWYKLREVEKFFFDFHNYIVRNRIFLDKSLQERFTKIDDIMWSTIVDRKVGHKAKDHKMWVEAHKKIRDEIDPIKNEVEDLVQKRLHYYEAD
jgi:uncharacterized protein YajQ (UPF0234 family)